MGQLNFDDILKYILFQVDDNWQHVTFRQTERCTDCSDKPCLTSCPSGVFSWNSIAGDPILIAYKQCVECGICRLICNNIEFSYPHGGFGVTYQQG
ncbi:MAG: 4Fe-4S ferredoxin, iron-sulpur binding protein [Firmicutes bacterium]|nr:4Fe-4S ferredoxin, iron-sulpur binding protein [Bacillota bacterium]